jgi:hypothetical protein
MHRGSLSATGARDGRDWHLVFPRDRSSPVRNAHASGRLAWADEVGYGVIASRCCQGLDRKVSVLFPKCSSSSIFVGLHTSRGRAAEWLCGVARTGDVDIRHRFGGGNKTPFSLISFPPNKSDRST